MKVLAVIFTLGGALGLLTAHIGVGLLSLGWAGLCLYGEQRLRNQIKPPT